MGGVWRGLRLMCLLLGLVGPLAWSPALATFAEDHQRGLLAYQRGDVVAAMSALRPGAQAGHAPSQSLLGYILDRADYTSEAARLWRLAAAQGDAEAHAGLAEHYLVGRELAKDEKQALRHFSEAADLGHAASILVVATAWIEGKMGTNAAAEPARARAVILRAAERGHLPSADALAKAYAAGGYGLPIDAAQAESWRARATAWRAQRATAPAAASGAAR